MANGYTDGKIIEDLRTQLASISKRHAKLVAACKQLRKEYIEGSEDDIYITVWTYELVFNILDEEPTND